MDKEHTKQIIKIIFEEDITDLRTIPLKEVLTNIGLSIFIILMTAGHLLLSLWQFVVSLLLVGYDAISKALEKVMPGPKTTKKEAVEKVQS